MFLTKMQITNKKRTFLYNQIKIISGAILITLFFSLVFHQKIILSNLLSMFVLIIVQLELFIWLGHHFFKNIKKNSPNYKRQMIIRLVKFYVSVLFLAFIIFIIVYTGSYILLGGDFSDYFINLVNVEMKGFLISALIGFSLGALFFFYVQWAEALQREQKLTREKLIFQYETLKSQVNPHFLFNSLNTLSSLVRGNPDSSEEFIQKLSHIYRYILDDKDEEMVSLSEELNFVKDYFYLQKIRDEEKIELIIELNGLENVKILPVSLQLLVENALKHNSATRANPLVINIYNEGLEKLVVRNNIQKKNRLNETSGIGLKNLNERSKLILNSEIEIFQNEIEYLVKIPVKNMKL